VARIRSFRDLVAWQRAMELAETVFDVTSRFPHTERFGLTAQMRKAAISIPSNIAEGTRHRRHGYAHFLMIALGSHAELDTQCELATRCLLIPEADARRLVALLAEVGRLTHALRRSLTPPNP
jgi:four helix bundle protein